MPFFCPEIRICVVAVASGKGYFPCISETKYLRNGIKNNIPKQTEEPFVPSTEFQPIHSSTTYDIKTDDSVTTEAKTPAPKTIAPAPPQQTETDASTIEDLFKEAAGQIL